MYTYLITHKILHLVELEQINDETIFSFEFDLWR